MFIRTKYNKYIANKMQYLTIRIYFESLFTKKTIIINRSQNNNYN